MGILLEIWWVGINNILNNAKNYWGDITSSVITQNGPQGCKEINIYIYINHCLKDIKIA